MRLLPLLALALLSPHALAEGDERYASLCPDLPSGVYACANEERANAGCAKGEWGGAATDAAVALEGAMGVVVEGREQCWDLPGEEHDETGDERNVFVGAFTYQGWVLVRWDSAEYSYEGETTSDCSMLVMFNVAGVHQGAVPSDCVAGQPPAGVWGRLLP